MLSSILILAASLPAALGGERLRLIEAGGDPAPGLLVNETPGCRPFDPPDPLRPTLVFIHGANFAPRLVHFPMTRRLRESVERRGGPMPNVMGWDWNARARYGPTSPAHDENAIDQGRRLASALRAAGLAPGGIHLIGHSSGGVVAASAAADFARQHGGPSVAQVTLLDPALVYHDTIFRRLAVFGTASRVENVWAAGPSGFGGPTTAPGICNIRANTPGGLYGTIDPRYSAHLQAVRWYLETVADSFAPGGFNDSVFGGSGPPR